MLLLLRHRAFALLALLAFALGAAGHAHRAPSAAEEELAGYMQAGLVALDDICGMAGMGAASADCPLCRVEPGYLPPRPVAACARLWLNAEPLGLAEAEYPQPFRPRVSSKGPRAPPLA